MKKYFLLHIVFISANLFGQRYPEYNKSGKNEWTKKEWRSANTVRFSFYMGKPMRESIRLMNLSRMYGEKFSKIYIEPIANKNIYEISLIQWLHRQKPLEPLRPSLNLWGSAIFHAMNSGINGLYGHQGFKTRIAVFQPFGYGNANGENCDYGTRKGLDIALDLLIDTGNPDLGHRKNILYPDYARVGGAVFLHSIYKWNAVIEYSSSKWLDFLFYRKPDCSQFGLNLEISQISNKPMIDIGPALLVVHLKCTNMLIDINYQYGFLGNTKQAISGYLGYGSSSGLNKNFLIGAKLSSYFPESHFNLYLQPTVSYFTIISFFRKGYTYYTGDRENSALYRFSYGYNFSLVGNRNSNVYKHNLTISRFICLKSSTLKDKKHKKNRSTDN